MALAVLQLLAAGLFCSTARAVDLDGAWATDAGSCSKVFVKKGGQTRLSPSADLYGSGFVIDGSAIRGKIATCKITSLKEDGPTVHIEAACATDIMHSSNDFTLKRIDDNKLVRAYPGIPEMDTLYFRCR